MAIVILKPIKINPCPPLPSPDGFSTFTQPSATTMEFSASGASGRDMTMGIDTGNNRGQVSLTGAPGNWGLGFTGTGNLGYAASGGTAGLDSFATWNGAELATSAESVPEGVLVVPEERMWLRHPDKWHFDGEEQREVSL